MFSGTATHLTLFSQQSSLVIPDIVKQLQDKMKLAQTFLVEGYSTSCLFLLWAWFLSVTGESILLAAEQASDKREEPTLDWNRVVGDVIALTDTQASLICGGAR